jgi:membrane associated rhomboid family serine protease
MGYDARDDAGPPPLPGEPSVRARLLAAPVTTAVGTAAAAATFIWWLAARDATGGEGFRNLLWHPASETWSGAWWTLLTNSLLHVNSAHLGFNLYWMYRLMTECERRTGPLRWLAFFLVTTAFASFAELALSDDTGVGLSGFGYAAFGLAWRRSKSDPRWRGVVRPRDPLLWLGWGVVCWVATVTGVWRVGNAAHAAGLVAGLGLAYATEPSRWRVARVAAAALALAAPVVGAAHGIPWSGSWHYAQAMKAYHVSDAAAAIPELRRARELGFDAGCCLEGIAAMEIVRHDRAAYEAAMNEYDAFDAARSREARARQEGGAGWEVLCAKEALDARDARAALTHLVRARDRGTDRKWCLANLAWAHFVLRHAAEYDATMSELKTLDPTAWEDARERYGESVPGTK